jgi:hypothetical protein
VNGLNVLIQAKERKAIVALAVSALVTDHCLLMVANNVSATATK